MIIPYKAEISTIGIPVSNYLIMVAMVGVFVLQKFSSADSLTPFMLTGWSFPGLIGHMWLHNGYFHIIANLIFL